MAVSVVPPFLHRRYILIEIEEEGERGFKERFREGGNYPVECSLLQWKVAPSSASSSHPGCRSSALPGGTSGPTPHTPAASAPSLTALLSPLPPPFSL